MTDMAVASTAYQTAKSMGASDKVILALFEAGIVESNFENLQVATDHDSLGFLQQRPSAGWPNPTDVPTATRSFVSKAMAVENNYSTAGQLAQAVQVSAFPMRYDQAQAQAQSLLSQASSGAFTGLASASSTAAGLLSNPFGNIIKLFKDLIDPSWWKRVGIGVLGVGIIVGSLYFLFHDKMDAAAQQLLGGSGNADSGTQTVRKTEAGLSTKKIEPL